MSEVFRDMPRVEMLGGARVVPRLVGASDSIPDVSAAVNDMDRPPRLSRWGLRPLLAVLALVAGLAACGTSEPPSIVLVVIDTVRADHLTPYGYVAGHEPAHRATGPLGYALSPGRSCLAVDRPVRREHRHGSLSRRGRDPRPAPPTAALGSQPRPDPARRGLRDRRSRLQCARRTGLRLPSGL
jgi:hypothetical protein